jgi:hypothetical protein
MSTEKGLIVGGSTGSFLDPPSYPTHFYHVETDLRKRPANRGVMSLTYAVTSEWLDDDTRARVKRVLDGWTAPPLSDPATAEWVSQVLGYFAGCYKGEDGPECWHAGKLRINMTVDPMLNVDLHAGVHLIREFYPDFTPTAQDFEHAHWGERKQA